jgi:hypothetical protein
VYAEMSGGDDMEPTYSIIPYKRPAHYIEPNLPFFLTMESLLVNMITELGGRGLISEVWKEKYLSLLDLTRNSREIVENEILDDPISVERNEFIVSVPDKLARIVVPPGSSPETYTDNPDDLKMALVADVFTNSGLEIVLEVATGIPYRMHVALVDGQGGRRIATAYTFSYYEFTNPMDERLNDDEWKEQVYAPGADLSGYLPDWVPRIH